MEKGIFKSEEKFNWVGVTKSQKKSVSDITLNKAKTKGKEIVSITFRNGCAEIISNSEYILLTEPIKNRIYFKEGNSENGLLMGSNKNSTSGNKYARISREDVARKFFDMLGDYELKFDSFNELYYIEK